MWTGPGCGSNSEMNFSISDPSGSTPVGRRGRKWAKGWVQGWSSLKTAWATHTAASEASLSCPGLYPAAVSKHRSFHGNNNDNEPLHPEGRTHDRGLSADCTPSSRGKAFFTEIRFWWHIMAFNAQRTGEARDKARPVSRLLGNPTERWKWLGPSGAQ